MASTFLSRVRIAVVALASNAWTRTAFEPAAARRIAGLRYWDGGCVS
jgi:hypothetical protein